MMIKMMIESLRFAVYHHVHMLVPMYVYNSVIVHHAPAALIILSFPACNKKCCIVMHFMATHSEICHVVYAITVPSPMSMHWCSYCVRNEGSQMYPDVHNTTNICPSKYMSCLTDVLFSFLKRQLNTFCIVIF
jgi:hypothetical protein